MEETYQIAVCTSISLSMPQVMLGQVQLGLLLEALLLVGTSLLYASMFSLDDSHNNYRILFRIILAGDQMGYSGSTIHTYLEGFIPRK